MGKRLRGCAAEKVAFSGKMAPNWFREGVNFQNCLKTLENSQSFVILCQILQTFQCKVSSILGKISVKIYSKLVYVWVTFSQNLV